MELCGHATLASSFVILNYYEPESDEVIFNTLSGPLTVKRKGSLYEMDFPMYELREIPVTDEMERAFGARPLKAVLGLDLICVFDSEETVREMTPDQALITGIPGRRLRFAEFLPDACHCGGSGLRFCALPDCRLLGRYSGKERNPRLPGFKARRTPILQAAGE